MKSRVLPILVIIVVVLIIAITGRMVTASNMDWYQTLNLPSFTPPGAVIGTVWSVIYVLCGIAAWRIWNWNPHDGRFRLVCGIGVLNVALNASWSFLFFGLHLINTSVVAAISLALTVAALIALTWRRDMLSAILLAPYFAWMVFASILAASVAALN